MGRMDMVKKFSGETEWLQKRLDDNPHSILFAHLADRYLDAGDINRAIEVCDKGLEYYPGYSTGLFVYAKCLLRKTEYEEAEKQLKKVISINPNNLLALKLYGDLMAEMGWSRTADECYKRIMDLDPLEQNVRAKLPGSLVSAGKQPISRPQGKEPVTRLEIDDKSIENLFKNDVEVQESSESIETLFGGNLDEQVNEPDNFARTAQPNPHGLTNETMETLFEPGEDDFKASSETTAPAKESWEEFNDDSIISLFDKEPEPYKSAGVESSHKASPPSREVSQQQDVDESFFMFGQEEEEKPFVPKNKLMPEPEFSQTNFQDEQELSFPVAGEEEPEEEGFKFPESGQDEQEDFQFPIPATRQGRNANPEHKVSDDSFITGEDEDEYAFSPDEVKPENDRFSNILDGIFSPGLDDEDRKDLETRNKLGGKPGGSDFITDDEEVDQDIFGVGAVSSREDDSLFPTEEELDEEPNIQLAPEDTILQNASNARFIPSQPEEDPEEESFTMPDISEGYLAFEEDDSEDNIETEAVHMPDVEMVTDSSDSSIEEEEEELGNFLAGLGDHEDMDLDVKLPEQEDDVFQTRESKPKPTPEKPTGPTFRQPPLEKEPGGGTATSKDKFVTPTLGEIYAAQGQYAKAINVFELLLEKSPENDFYKSKLDYLKKKLSEENK